MRIDYLRVSVTDRCNLRCIYCNPLGNCNFLRRDEILTFEEIHHIVRLFAQCGISRVRLTGGEPLVRKNIIQLVRSLAAIASIEELTLTTNGVLLEQVAVELKSAGLHRINISVDSLDRERYRLITEFDLLENVKRGIHKAIEVGLKPVKINTVVLRGINEQDVVALAQLSVQMPVAVRFIEYCPTSKSTEFKRFFVPNNQVRRNIESRFGPLAATVVANAAGPAVYFKVKHSAGCIGFISGKSTFFCERCNRLRLTSDGKVRPCLYSAHHYDIKGLIRSGADDETLLDLLKRIISEKANYTRLNSPAEEFSMRNVGG
ncbi:MAG: GTP 3',8-cyclase MoaA [Planctomycetota bacterium]|jgi:cyclic pyranopterin phosphate synthase